MTQQCSHRPSPQTWRFVSLQHLSQTHPTRQLFSKPNRRSPQQTSTLAGLQKSQTSHSSNYYLPVTKLQFILLCICQQRIFKYLQRRSHQPRPYLTDTCILVCDACINARCDSQLNNFSNVNPCWCAAKI